MSLYTFGDLKGYVSTCSRYGELDQDLSSEVISRKGSSNFESKLQFILGKLINERVNPEGSLIVSIDSVVHNEKLSIRWVNA